MTPIYILICLALVGCEGDNDPKKPLGRTGSGFSYDSASLCSHIEDKLIVIAEKLERIALALERK